ncbi:MAG: fimbrillin family protein [Parabacteroides sp.]|nr:fimbrillin family protein [Parabacteroides sp.]
MTKVVHIILYIVAILGLAISGGCCKSDEPVPPGPTPPPDPDPDPPITAVPIRLNTRIMSRAIVDNFDSTALCIAKGNVEGQYDELWNAIATNTDIHFVPERYYPTDSSAVYLTGYYPQAPMNGGFAEFDLDGQTDVMAADGKSGSLTDTFEGGEKQFLFRHLLALLKITVSLAADRPETYYLKSLGLNGSSEAARLDLTSGELLFGTETPKLVLYDAGTADGVEISAASAFKGNLLVQPRTELTVDLVLSKDGDPDHDLVYTGLPVHFTGDGSEGNVAYNIDIIIGSPDLPIGPDNPDNPDKPDYPDPVPPDIPDEPDIPVPPVDPVDPPATTPAITITATVTDWDNIPGGNLDFVPSNK